jgi:hypothetical protein
LARDQVVDADAALLRIRGEVLEVGEAHGVIDAARLVELPGGPAHHGEELRSQRVVRGDAHQRHVEPAELAVDVVEDADVGVRLRQKREQIVVAFDAGGARGKEKRRRHHDHDGGPGDGLPHEKGGEGTQHDRGVD